MFPSISGSAYVSPSWYPSKTETQRVALTWNYLAVHVEGQARIIEDVAWLKQHLRVLTDRNESGLSEPWSIDDAPANFTERLVQAIVGIEISIERLTGKLKANQNLPERDRRGVRAGLEAAGDAGSRARPRFMSEVAVTPSAH